MFPDGEVTNLGEAMSSEYDDYFDGFQKFKYERCQIGFWAELESPNWGETLAYNGKSTS